MSERESLFAFRPRCECCGLPAAIPLRETNVVNDGREWLNICRECIAVGVPISRSVEVGAAS